MGKYIINRLISTLMTLFLIITLSFFLMHAIPGGPFDLLYQEMPEESLRALNERFHLNAPLYVQYLSYLNRLLHGDLGVSCRLSDIGVNDLLAQGFPISSKIGMVSIITIVTLGLLLGTLSALHWRRTPDHLITIFTTLGISIPGFVTATFILYFFCERLRLLPSNGLYTWKHYIGPVITLSLFSTAFIVRLVSANLIEILHQDYIRTAMANGLPARHILFKHAMRNALIPVITYVGPTFAAVLTGSFVVEKVFTIPGMGKYFVDSISSRDYTVLMGTTLFYAVIVVSVLFLIDLLYAWIDPRIKLR